MGFLDALNRSVGIVGLVPGCTTERDGYKVVKYGTTYAAFRILSTVKRYRINAHGIEHIREGPAWIVSKHMHDKDIPDISSIIHRRTGEIPYFVAKRELGEDPWERAQYGELGAIFIDRENPSPATIRDIVGTVRGGNKVVVFPEGTRAYGRELGPFQEGTAMMACRLYDSYGVDAPIYCVGVRRPENPKKGVTINIAPPMYISEFEGTPKAKRRKVTERMWNTVGFLCTQEGRETDHVSKIEALEELVMKWLRRGKRLILTVPSSVSAAHSRLSFDPGNSQTSF